MIRSGPSVCRTASRCSGLRPSSDSPAVSGRLTIAVYAGADRGRPAPAPPNGGRRSADLNRDHAAGLRVVDDPARPDHAEQVAATGQRPTLRVVLIRGRPTNPSRIACVQFHAARGNGPGVMPPTGSVAIRCLTRTRRAPAASRRRWATTHRACGQRPPVLAAVIADSGRLPGADGDDNVPVADAVSCAQRRRHGSRSSTAAARDAPATALASPAAKREPCRPSGDDPVRA